MKNHNRSNRIIRWALLSALFAAAACSKESAGEWPQEPQEETVQLRITVDREAATATRAAGDNTISDGRKVDMLVCAVYDSSGKLLRQYGDAYVDEDNEDSNRGESNGKGQIVFRDIEWPVVLDLTLVRSQTYKLVFWAQNSACKAYDTDDLKAVKIDYSAPNNRNNDESRDAFCKTEEFTAVGHTSSERFNRNITLRRPFAQINVGSSLEDFAAAREQGYEIVESQITILDAATQLNVVDNTVDVFDDEGNYSTPAEPVTFAFAPLAAFSGADPGQEEFLYVDVEQDKQLTAHKYLSMCYVLAADKREGTSTYATYAKLAISFKYANGETHTLSYEDESLGLQQVPMQRNWCTNIVFGLNQLLPQK